MDQELAELVQYVVQVITSLITTLIDRFRTQTFALFQSLDLILVRRGI
jgi:hypothetical protein